MPYLVMYVLLGVCVALLAFTGYQLYRQHSAGLRHNGSRRSRKWFRRSHH